MNPNMSAAAALSLPLVLATVTALWFRSWLLGGGGRRYMVLGGKGQRAERVRLGVWRWPALIFAAIPLLLSLVLPIFALLSAALMDKWWRGLELGNLTLANFAYLFADSTTTAAIRNSLILSVGVGLVMALGGGAIAILIAGEQTGLKRLIRRLCELPLGVPHIVAGILIILAWYGPPFNLGGTLGLLAVGYIFLMLPYAVTTCEAARDQIDSSLADAASSSGFRPYQVWLHILLPLMKSGLFTTFIIVFLFVIKEFSLTAMVYSAPTQTLAVRVFTFLDGGSYEKTAAAAMLLLAITFAGLFVASKVFKISASDLRV
jgi:iron(III) transport system permease protein